MRVKGKNKMIIWIIIGSAAIAAIAALIIFYPMLSMKPAETGEVPGTDITAVRNGGNTVFFIKTDNSIIAVDSGSNMGNLENALAELTIDPLEVSHVLLTHSDSDHINGLNLFANAAVCISEDEMQLLAIGDQNNSSGRRSLPDGFGSARLAELKDGQELSVDGLSITCIKTPGHTIGSMSFLVDKAYLFTGDAIRIKGDAISLHPFTREKEQAASTIDRLHELMKECQIVLTAHYGYRQTEDIIIG